MPQYDYNVANATAPNFRSDLNNNLSAIASQNSGTTAPSNTFANMIWYDSTNNILKMRNEADSAWISLFTLDQSGNLSNIVQGTSGSSGSVGIWDSNGDLTSGIPITGAVTATADNDGAKSSGTYTPVTAGGNFKRITNEGAFTLAAPTDSGDYTMVIQITNTATAGAITLSGFNKTSGSTFTITNGHDFFVFITKLNGFVLSNVALLQ
jgi:hypothetical protein